MQVSKKAEFLAALLTICTIVMVVVLLIDFSIKTAILEESNKLRLIIEREEVVISGRRRAEANPDGNAPKSAHDPVVFGDLLVDDPTGMETSVSDNGAEKTIPNPANRRAKPSRPNRSRTIASGDQ